MVGLDLTEIEGISELTGLTIISVLPEDGFPIVARHRLPTARLSCHYPSCRREPARLSQPLGRDVGHRSAARARRKRSVLPAPAVGGRLPRRQSGRCGLGLATVAKVGLS